ncbi:ribonuclease H-like domain, reverse transcriptase, RNA-dependent DNA polymerase [Tanacetum coccineum]
MTKDSRDSSKKEVSTTSTPQFQCPMLKPSNYSLWAIRMQIILEANGLWETIEPLKTTQPDNKKDKTAIAFLYQALPEEQLLQITKHKTAKPLWYLQIVASIEQYSDLSEMTIEEAIGRLKTYEERIKYKKGKQVVDNQEKSDVHPDTKVKKITLEDVDVEKHRFLTGKTHEKFKEERKDGETSHRNFNRNNFKNSSYDTSKLQCYQCKKIGHIAPNCPQRTKANEQSNLVGEDLEPTLLMAILEVLDEGKQVKEVEEQKVSLHEEDVGYKETNMDSLWYLDNGASNNMTGVREHFKELDEKENLEVTSEHHDQGTQPSEEDNEFPNNNDDGYASPTISSPSHSQTPHTPSTRSSPVNSQVTHNTSTQSLCQSDSGSISTTNSHSHFDHTPLRGYRTLSDLYENTEELLLAEDEPKNYKEASSDQKWIEAMKVELDSINKNNTWELTTLPKGHKAIGLKWVFKTKKDANGNIIKHKARLVAKGYIQEHDIDFEEVFTPVARMETIRLLLAIAANNKWEVHHLDVKSAFLHGDLKEEVNRRVSAGRRDGGVGDSRRYNCKNNKDWQRNENVGDNPRMNRSYIDMVNGGYKRGVDESKIKMTSKDRGDREMGNDYMVK